MHEFCYRKGQLCCEQVPLETLARRHGTPLYVYSENTIKKHFQRLDQALAPLDHLICYAVKANSNLGILNTLARLNSGFDIVSMGELYRVSRAGGKTSQCVFAGVGKTEREIRDALQKNIYCFNVESEAELHRIHKVARAMRKRAPVALRVNPNVDAHTHAKITTGTYENKFGIAFEQVPDLYQRASWLPNVELRGIQMHIGSQITTVAPFIRAVRKMLPLVREMQERHRLQFFSIGGGIGIVYRSALESGHPGWWGGRKRVGRNHQPLTIDLFARSLIPLLKPLGMRILLEPGRYIAGNAGVLLTRVEYFKLTGTRNFAIVDAAMNDLIRPAFYDSYHAIAPLMEPPANAKESRYDVVGPICESGDYFAKDRALPPLREGDCLALMSAGAYGFTMASNYNARPRPAEVLVKGTTARLVRKRESLRDLVRGEKK
ncbi:MAG: diaminopimelate decarboxylase [Verrucomicrobiae bacterium]|nr:diaminopimelate decarboxylase [Verrucomicrobiae bacterium]